MLKFFFCRSSSTLFIFLIAHLIYTQRGKFALVFPDNGIRACLVEGSYHPVYFKMEGAVTRDGDMFKLIAENYSYQKSMMEDEFQCKDLHEPITNKNKPEGKGDKEWELLN